MRTSTAVKYKHYKQGHYSAGILEGPVQKLGISEQKEIGWQTLQGRSNVTNQMTYDSPSLLLSL